MAEEERLFKLLTGDEVTDGNESHWTYQGKNRSGDDAWVVDGPNLPFAFETSGESPFDGDVPVTVTRGSGVHAREFVVLSDEHGQLQLTRETQQPPEIDFSAAAPFVLQPGDSASNHYGDWTYKGLNRRGASVWVFDPGGGSPFETLTQTPFDEGAPVNILRGEGDEAREITVTRDDSGRLLKLGLPRVG